MSNKKKFIIFIACVALILVSYIKFFKPTNNINSDNGISYGNPNAKRKIILKENVGGGQMSCAESVAIWDM